MPNQLIISHVNICSIRHKVDHVKDALFTHAIDILCVTETWLESSIDNSIITCPGYSLFRRDRSGQRGGGVAIYVRNTLRASSVNLADDHSLEVLSIAVNLNTNSKGNHRHLTLPITCVYRPPSSPVSFWTAFTDYVDSLTDHLNSTNHCILGDLNTNTLRNTTTSLTHFRRFCSRFQVSNTISSPTRFGSNSCLDVILLHRSLTPANSSVVSTDGVSDHSLVLAAVNVVHPVDRSQKVYVRSRRPAVANIDFDQFSTDVVYALTAAGSDTANLNLHELMDTWTNCITSTLDTHCPVVARYVNPTRPPPKPWVTPELIGLFRKQKHLHRAALKHPDRDLVRQEFRTTRRQAVLLNKRLRTRFYQSKFLAASSNPRLHWELLNRLNGRKAVREPLPNAMEVSDVLAQAVNDRTRAPLRRPHGPAIDNSLSTFKDVSTAMVERLLKQLQRHKACGSDGIPPLVLKSCAKSLAPTLSGLLQESFVDGIVPECLKHASVTPLFKGGDRQNPRQYRPISLLPVVAKLAEKLVLQELSPFLTTHSILPDQQFAYRSSHSCEDALSYVIDTWQSSLDRGEYVGVLFVDLSKAFDSVEHQQLVIDLFDCGIHGKVLEWFMSYLSNRSQQLVSGDSHFPRVTCSKGVPQGSVLGPILFSLYVRQLPTIPQHSSVIQYADDVNMYASAASPKAVIDRLAHDLSRLMEFFRARSLTVNPKKTQFLLLHRSHWKLPLTNISVACGGEVIPRSSKATYLGVVIDDTLSFRPHLAALEDKVNKKLGAFRLNRSSFPVPTRRTFYIGIIQSTLEYATNAYLHCLSAADFHHFTVLFKRSLRTVFGLSPLTHTADILRNFRLQSILDRCTLKLCLLVYRCTHGMASQLLCDMFCFTVDLPGGRGVMQTRSQVNNIVSIPVARSSIGQHRLSVVAARRWNLLPNEIRLSTSFHAFHQLCLAHYFT